MVDRKGILFLLILLCSSIVILAQDTTKAIDAGIVNERTKLERLYFFSCSPLKFIGNSSEKQRIKKFRTAVKG
jgi:hypothetical protein